MLLAADRNLYGTTAHSLPGGNGTAFRLATNGTLATLVYFSSPEGANPHAGLFRAQTEIITARRNRGHEQLRNGLSIDGGGTLTTLASFNFTNGACPMAGLAPGSNGVFYGATCGGGTSDLGTDSPSLQMELSLRWFRSTAPTAPVPVAGWCWERMAFFTAPRFEEAPATPEPFLK